MNRVTKTWLDQSFITMIVAVIAIISAAIETDIFVPSFPALKEFFGTTDAAVQMLLSVNFLGLCLSSLVYGPLSDSYGRRPVLLVGLGIFALAGIGCILAESFESLIFWRFIQGLGSSAAFVVPGAIIFDLYTQEEAAKILGYYNSVITLVMSAAPMIGSYLHIHYGWQANFMLVGSVAVFAWVAVFCFVKESLDKKERQPFLLKTILKGYWALTTSFEAQRHLWIICFMFSAYLVFISNISLIFINRLHIPEHLFGFYQGAVLLVFAFVSIYCKSIIQYFGMDRTRVIGTWFSFAGACLCLATAYFLPTYAKVLIATMCIYTGGFAVMIGIVFGDYMAVYPEIKGIAAAFITALRLLFCSLMISVSGRLFDGTIVPVANIIFVLSVLATVLLLSKKTQPK